MASNRKLGREDGVAMTEFALVLPVFMLIVAGLLAFGRVLFYWIEANHLANETARWAAVDRRPYRARRCRRMRAPPAGRGSSPMRRSASRLSDGGDGGDRRPDPGEDLQAVLFCLSWASPRSRSAARRRCESSASRTATDNAELQLFDHRRANRGRALRSVHVNALRSERGGIFVISALIIPILSSSPRWSSIPGSGSRTSARSKTVPTRGRSRRGSSTSRSSPIVPPTHRPAATAIADKARLYAGRPAPGTTRPSTTSPRSRSRSTPPARTLPTTRTAETRARITRPRDQPERRHLDRRHRARDQPPHLRRSSASICPSIAAHARVELGQITGLAHGGLPFVHETGDYVDCALGAIRRVRNSEISSSRRQPRTLYPLAATPTRRDAGPPYVCDG